MINLFKLCAFAGAYALDRTDAAIGAEGRPGMVESWKRPLTSFRSLALRPRGKPIMIHRNIIFAVLLVSEI